jgi:hypothetical protein
MASFKKIAESNMVKMGAEVVPIKARLMAVVYWPAIYTKLLNKRMQLRDTAKKYFQFLSTSFLAAMKLLRANGNNRMLAESQRKKFILTGGILPEMPRAITKFTDQIIAAITAKLTPIYKFFLPG